MHQRRFAAAVAKLPAGSAPGLAIGLGGVGLTLRELVSLYASIARGGTPIRLHDGITTVVQDANPAPVLDPAAPDIAAYADPVPQALVLTAIVINFAIIKGAAS